MMDKARFYDSEYIEESSLDAPGIQRAVLFALVE